jgi:hypothetical protein
MADVSDFFLAPMILWIVCSIPVIIGIIFPEDRPKKSDKQSFSKKDLYKILGLFLLQVIFLIFSLSVLFCNISTIYLLVVGFGLIYTGYTSIKPNHQTNKFLRRVQYSVSFPLVSIFMFFFTFNLAFLFSNIVFLPSTIGFSVIVNSTQVQSSAYQLLQVHATVYSIIIAVTIVAFQFTFERYSYRIVENLKYHFDIWAISAIYLVAFLTDLIIMYNDNFFNWTFNGKILVTVGFFAIISIFPYFWNMMVTTRPENIANNLQLKIFKHPGDTDNNSQRVLALLDIMQASLIKGEFFIYWQITNHLECIFNKKIGLNYTGVMIEKCKNMENYSKKIELQECEKKANSLRMLLERNY